MSRAAPCLFALLLAAQLGCHAAAPPAVAHSDASTPASRAACAAPAVRPDGGCCPPGQFYAAPQHSCLPLGPPECATNVLDPAVPCVPRWCRDVAEAALPCAPSDTACGAHGRLCTAAEIAAGDGCPAGQVPISGNHPPCRLAGDLDLPPIAPLPAPATPQSCADVVGNYGPCVHPAVGCPAGEARASADPGAACTPIGVGWVCPPGFVTIAGPADVQSGLPLCTPDPADCGTDPYGGVAEAPGVVFVDGAFTGASTGSRAAPWPTVAAALATAPLGGVIAIAAGKYVGTIQIGAPITLRGRCAAMTSLVGTAGAPAVRVKGSAAQAVVLRDLTITGPDRGLYVDTSASVTASHLALQGAADTGVTAGKSGVLSLSDSWISDTQPKANGQSGRGAWVISGGQFTLVRVRLHANREAGIVAAGVASGLQASELIIDGTRPQAVDNAFGRGIDLADGATAVLTDTALIGNRESVLRVTGVGTNLLARRLAIAHTLPMLANGKYGDAIDVRQGAHAVVHGARITGTWRRALIAVDPGTQLTVHHVAIADTGAPPPLPTEGCGAFAGVSASLVVDGAAFEGTRGIGVVSAGGAQVTVRRALIRDTGGQLGSDQNSAVHIDPGAGATLQHVRITHSLGVGLAVVGTGAKCSAEDVTVDDTRAAPDVPQTCVGINASLGATLKLTTVRTAKNHGAGLAVLDGGTTVSAVGLTVDGNVGLDSTHYGGHGIILYAGSQLTVTGGRISGNHRSGLAASQASSATLRDVSIDGTLPDAMDQERGFGITAFSGAHIRLAHCLIADNTVFGLFATGAGTTVVASDLCVRGGRPSAKDGGGGRGIEIETGAQLDLAGARVLDNIDMGVAAILSQARLVGTVLAGTVMNPTVGANGQGFVALNDSRAAIIASLVDSNHTAGVMYSLQSGGTVVGSVVAHTMAGAARVRVGGKFVPGAAFGDGLLLYAGQSVEVSQCLLAANSRAGLLVQASANTQAQATAVLHNSFGIALQQGALIAETGVLSYANAIENRVGGSGLAIGEPPQLASPIDP